MTAKSILRAGAVFSIASLIAGAAGAQDVAVGPTASAGAVANEAGPEADTIVVTGSRIRRDPLDQEAPVITLDQSSIAKTGLTSVADILQRLPSAAGGLNTKTNNSGNIGNPPDGGGVGAGSATIDLRYLSSKRTLVLVDGLRFVNGSSASGIPASVDINSIPTAMVDRIEVLQSGASPIYGSDAIAGVVNIITKTKQKGLQADAYFGTFRQGDGHTWNGNISYGIQGPTTSVVLGASYVKQQPVRSSARSISLFPNPGQTSCADPVGGCSSAAINGRFLTAFGNQTIATAPDFTPTAGELRNFTANDRFNFAPYNYILTPSERYGAYASFKQEVTDDVHLRVNAVYNRRNSQNQAAFLPLFVGPDSGNGNLLDTVSIDATNPYNPFGVTLSSGANGVPANYSFIARRLVEAGQRTYTQHVDTMSVTATLDGSFMVGSRKWYWDANAVLGINDAEQSFTGNVNAANVQRALGPLAQCTGACVPLNLFGGAGTITAAQLNYISFTERDSSKQILNDYTANLSGDLIDLPGGPLAFALGYEHRFQKANYVPDALIVAGLGADIPSDPAYGKYDVDEFYGELRVPILKEVPFFYSLEADGAVRHSDYSTGFKKTTYVGSALWKPIQDLLLRGSYAQGFRAPSLGELFGGRSRFDSTINDPCTSAAGGSFATNATVRANCIANGVPANGSYVEPQGGQLPVITSGNRNLAPESSRTLLFGAVYSPAWAREAGLAGQLSIEGNYYDIRVKNAISTVSADVLLDRCYTQSDATSCGFITRTGSGFISQISGVLQNVDSIRTKGVDVTMNYRTPQTSIGTIGLTVNASFLLKYDLTSPGAAPIKFRGTERGSPDQAYPRFKTTSVIDWAIGDFDASFTGRYLSGVTEFAYDTDPSNDGRLKRRFYGDAQVNYTPSFLDKRFLFTVGVNNVFNSAPPACVSCNLNNYDPTSYDVPGQFGYLRISYKM